MGGVGRAGGRAGHGMHAGFCCSSAAPLPYVHVLSLAAPVRPCPRLPPAAALAAGPLEVGPNLMQQLGSVLALEGGSGGGGGGGPAPASAAAASAATPDADALLRQLKALQEQVALLDRIQNIRWVCV